MMMDKGAESKNISRDAIHAFEIKRKAKIDIHSKKDESYWDQFESVIRTSEQQTASLEAFFLAKLRAVCIFF